VYDRRKRRLQELEIQVFSLSLSLSLSVQVCSTVHLYVFLYSQEHIMMTRYSTLYRYYEYINLVCKKKTNVAVFIVMVVVAEFY
jgi:hypothetical protein